MRSGYKEVVIYLIIVLVLEFCRTKNSYCKYKSTTKFNCRVQGSKTESGINKLGYQNERYIGSGDQRESIGLDIQNERYIGSGDQRESIGLDIKMRDT